MAALFGSTDYAPPTLTSDETALISKLEGQELNQPTQPVWVRHEFPDWLEAPLTDRFSDQLEHEMKALNEPAPVDLRVNTFKADREDLQAQFNAADIACEPTLHSPIGLRLQGRPRVTHTKMFKDGLIEVQDEGSQLASLLVDARAGMTVIDYCAGAGGKTLALVNAMIEGNRFDGMFWACDVAESRLRELEKRATRNGTNEAIVTHLLQEDDVWLGDNVNLADRVLADVPCSGSGAWRRESENRWRLTPDSLNEHVTRQREILTKAAGLVKQGGRLIYVTCSILPSENEGQIEWFLENHSDFSLFPVAVVWAMTIGSPLPISSETVRLSPAATGTDGFFVAILQRD